MLRKSFLRKFYEFFLHHWFLKTTITQLSSILFLLFIILFLINQDNLLFIPVWVLVVIVFFIFIIFLFDLLKSLGDKYNEFSLLNGQYILYELVKSINYVKERKLNRFIEYIQKNINSTDLSPFNEITQPKTQIHIILENIKNIFSKVFDIDEKEIGISLIYKYDNGSSWQWLDKINISNVLTLETLIKDKKSTLNRIILDKHNFYMIPDKRVGLSNNTFIPDEHDQLNNTIGSIICVDLSLPGVNKTVSAVLSISTYGHQICDESDVEALYNVEHIIIPPFIFRLKNELALLYIKEKLTSS